MSEKRAKKVETKPEAESVMKVAVGEEAGKPKAKVAKSSAKTTQTASTSDQEVQEKRKCTYRIPYVGRTVSVPCRN